MFIKATSYVYESFLPRFCYSSLHVTLCPPSACAPFHTSVCLSLPGGRMGGGGQEGLEPPPPHPPPHTHIECPSPSCHTQPQCVKMRPSSVPTMLPQPPHQWRSLPPHILLSRWSLMQGNKPTPSTNLLVKWRRRQTRTLFRLLRKCLEV